MIIVKGGGEVPKTKQHGTFSGLDLTKITTSTTDYSTHLGGTKVMGSVKVGDAVTQIPVHNNVVGGGCKVGCSGGRTIATAPYESVKITVWLEMPSAPDTINETFDFVSDWVGEQLNKAVAFAKE